MIFARDIRDIRHYLDYLNKIMKDVSGYIRFTKTKIILPLKLLLPINYVNQSYCVELLQQRVSNWLVGHLPAA